MTRKRPKYLKRFRKPGLLDPSLQGLPKEEAREIAQRKHDEKVAEKAARKDDEHQRIQRLQNREWST